MRSLMMALRGFLFVLVAHEFFLALILGICPNEGIERGEVFELGILFCFFNARM